MTVGSRGIKQSMNGCRDTIVGNIVAGWAINGESPAIIDLFIDGKFISRTPAAKFRADLVGLVSPHGHCAFNIAVPKAFCDGENKLLTLKFAGTEIILDSGEFNFSHVHEFRPPLLSILPDPKFKEIALRCLSLLKPADVVGGKMARIGGEADGGYVMLDRNLDNATCYSLGINDDVAWDMAMAERGCRIFQYDHTIELLPETHPNFHWEKIGIARDDSSDGVFKSIPRLVKDNGHASNRDLILKCDIEGYEWEVLNGLSEDALGQFSQIVMEMHSFEVMDNESYMAGIFSALEKLNKTHQLIHIHGNNCGNYVIAGGVGLPSTFEVTYVRRSDYEFSTCYKAFPTELDQPCTEQAADFYLGQMGLFQVSPSREKRSFRSLIPPVFQRHQPLEH